MKSPLFDVRWKCPNCGYQALVLPSVYIQCHCGELSPSPALIRRRRPKTKEQRVLYDFQPPESGIDEHF